jgi:protein required for attachment to host cells
VDFRARATRLFAREIAAEVSQQLRSGECEGVVLVAAPRLLKQLRTSLPLADRGRIIREIPKDLIRQPASVLRDQLREVT